MSSFLPASECKREKEEATCERRRLICMSAPLSRQKDRLAERPGGGGHSSSAFSKTADWLPPVSAQEPGNRQHAFLPLIAADETLMRLCLPRTWHMQTSQIQATAMCCGQLQHAKPGQGSDQIQIDADSFQF